MVEIGCKVPEMTKITLPIDVSKVWRSAIQKRCSINFLRSLDKCDMYWELTVENLGLKIEEHKIYTSISTVTSFCMSNVIGL